MKNLTYIILLIICFAIGSCKKEGGNSTVLPESVNFELVDKTGNSLVKSLKDSVKISYIQNGATQYHNLSVQKLPVNYNDTTSVEQYNGLVINDEKFMSNLSSSVMNPNPVRNFNIYLNNIIMGNIFMNYSNGQITFNNIPVKNDRSFQYFEKGSDIFVLPVQ